MCGALDSYKDNFTGQDLIWSVVCKYFFECHQNQALISPKVAFNLVLIECKQFVKARPNNQISKYLKNLLKILDNMFGKVFSLGPKNPNFFNSPIGYYYILFILLHKTDHIDHTTLITFYPRPAYTTAIASAAVADHTTFYLIPLLFTSIAPTLG